MRALPLLLADILTAARDIADYARVGREAFIADRMRLRATIQCFEVVGEATKKLPDEYRAAHPEVPWRLMAAFRDKLIHDYFEVDPALVWTTASRDIPALLPRLEVLGGNMNPKTDP
ncbi:DUF86 domain-containing protein [Pseudothauera nasutitermitis]|uniref:DUF86 domain-containing protein n=2 Tax=Pseudothauera nasutitermitis TaxID=2565930 RepID=A0A4S4AXZ2_9RHOO|nr:DUF86 domain-containing protein [Pseudothauera nasutitermitis]